MKLQLKCDSCGTVGDPQTIFTDYDDMDFCVTCTTVRKLHDLKIRLADKRAWLESTHLKEMRELENQIDAIEKRLKPGR
jgi:hypothetical protein